MEKQATLVGGKSSVAKKTHFDSETSIDRMCQLMFNSINRGWLNAVAWELVPKIQGRETEVTS